MIICRTPFRVSFFGGGSDFPEWYLGNGGAVLSGAIDKYCYISIRELPPFFEHVHRLVYSKVENVSVVEEFKHPVVREILMREPPLSIGLEIHHDGDLPARSGLGSSSAFTVGFLNALKAHQGKRVSPYWLAQKAIDVERNWLKEAVGVQDQIAVAHGGFNKVKFLPDGSYEVSPARLSPEVRKRFDGHLLLCFTGVSRYSHAISQKTVGQLHKKQLNLHKMIDMVDQGLALLEAGAFREFGQLLTESWRLKREFNSEITNASIDNIIEIGIEAGAYGGKLLGAGGGGFMIFYVNKENRKNVMETLKDYLIVPVKFENKGSHIILNEN